MTDDELKQLVESNARSIQALTEESKESEKRLSSDRTRMYRAIAHMSEGIAQLSDRVASIASAQSSFWEVQADYFRRLEEMDERHAQLVEIMRLLRENLNR